MISLLHGTARPHKWLEVCKAWYEASDYKSDIEYVLVYEPEKFFGEERDTLWTLPFSWRAIIENVGRPCVVDAYNLAADSSKGDLLVFISDDLWPTKGWDTALLKVATEAGIHNEKVFWIDTADDMLDLNHPVLTRAYFERKGYLLWPEYEGLWSDMEFSTVAKRDGVIVDVRDTVHTEHRAAFTGKIPHDDVNLKMLSYWVPQEILYKNRERMNFPTDICNLKPIGLNSDAVYIPKGLRSRKDAA